jgi:hypothetical protein
LQDTKYTKDLLTMCLYVQEIKDIQSIEIINTSSQACPNSTYAIGLLINGIHNTQDPTRKCLQMGCAPLEESHHKTNQVK